VIRKRGDGGFRRPAARWWGTAFDAPAAPADLRPGIHRAARELTAVRLLTLHNLTFMAHLMRRLRSAITTGEYLSEAAKLLETGPYDA
jgi:hypothetical protein